MYETIFDGVAAATAALAEIRERLLARRRSAGRKELRKILKLYSIVLELLKVVPADIKRLRSRNPARDAGAVLNAMYESRVGLVLEFCRAARDLNQTAIGIFAPGMETHIYGLIRRDCVYADELGHAAAVRQFKEAAAREGLSAIAREVPSHHQKGRGRASQDHEQDLASLPGMLKDFRQTLAEFIKENWTIDDILSP